jgi:hypothetical protein
MMSRCAALAALLLLLVVPAGPAAADSPSSGGDVTIAQTLGDRDVTLILRRVTSVPGPLRVDVITHVGTPAGTLTLAVIPASSGTPAGSAQVNLGATPGSYGATLRIAGAGSWELSVGDGQRTARVPFVVTAQVASPPERAVYGGFLAAGILLLMALVVAVRARQAWWVAVPGAGVVAGVAVAVTGAVLSASLPLPPRPGLQIAATEKNAINPYALSQPLIVDYSRPPAVLTVAHRSATGDIDLTVTDASTGLPADDLVVHDDALIHLMVVGPSGQLWHVHPIRIGLGAYQVHLPLPHTGHYALTAELQRLGGGRQLLRAATGIDVTAPPATAAGTAPAITLTAGRSTKTTVDGVPVSVKAASATAGSAVTFTLTAGSTATLQPWLGMLGHLIVVGPLAATSDAGAAAQAAPTWVHAHSMGDLTPMPGMPEHGAQAMSGSMQGNGDSVADETVAAYGPSTSFTYTFAQAGRYRLWMQVERDYRILTVPVLLDIAAARL